MHKIILLLLIPILLSCNEYEIPHPNLKVNVHVVHSEKGTIYEDYKGVLRVSDFAVSTNSFFFIEDVESVWFDSSYINSNGDLSFDVPFIEGIPPRYYELYLTKEAETPISEGRFFDEYVQHDTIRIGSPTHLDIKIRNDSCRRIAFSTLGYRTQADYKRDSSNFFINPDYIARLGTTKAKSTIISKTLPFSCNKFMVLQIIDRSVHPPILIKYDILEMEADSIKVHNVQL